MVFTSPIFLFLFLPSVLAVHFTLRRRGRNVWLLLASLVFYAWGEPDFLPVMLVSIVANFVFGIFIDRAPRRVARHILAVAVTANVGLLVMYKYANFLVHSANPLLIRMVGRSITLRPIALPIGISFITFHALSYVIDVYRRERRAQTNPLDLALYIALFPQLVAGPILRYAYLAPQIADRTITVGDFAVGVRRFIVGFGKKVLIANRLAVPADAIFGLSPEHLNVRLSWLAVTCYMLQIYFDFSGYSDMAIGLGRMFGFRFIENFDYPHVSTSVREFWQRWHISLSTWFRDYLYIPLGGSRGSAARTYFNLVTVFTLCGLWHGARWTFVVWGLYHGMFLVLERVGFSKVLERWWAPFRHAYLLLAVAVGWVFFRSDDLSAAVMFLTAMAGGGHGTNVAYHPALYLDSAVMLALIAGAVGSIPVVPQLSTWRARIGYPSLRWAADLASLAALALVLLVSCMALAAGTYNPFIYYRF